MNLLSLLSGRMDKKLAEVEGRLQEVQQAQVEVRLQEARERWVSESRKERELSSKVASIQAQQHLQDTVAQVKQVNVPRTNHIQSLIRRVQ